VVNRIGIWSDMSFMMIEEFWLLDRMFVKMLSINVAVVVVILVGRRIVGKSWWDIRMLKNILVGLCLAVFNKSMLKSPSNIIFFHVG